MKVIRWPTDVNQIILDSTTMTIGESGYLEQESETKTFTERTLTSLAAPDTYNVTMDFDWAVKDSNGKSEFDRFVEWFKYQHKRGVNPFEFPSIASFTVNGSVKTCQYKITSALSPVKSGYSMRVTMTWKEVYSGAIILTEPSNTLQSITPTNGKITCVYYANIESDKPTVSGSTLEYKSTSLTSWNTLTINSITAYGKYAYVNFTPITSSGDYNIRFNDGTTEKTAVLRIGE